MNTSILEIDYTHDILASTLLDPINYNDCFELKGTFKNIDYFSREYFLAQPTWLRAISFGIIRKITLVKTLNNTTFEKNDSIGQWKVYGRNEKEIVFGQDMGFMEYCFSFYQKDEETLNVSTIVQYKGKMGKFYFAIVSLLHKPFVKLSLENTLKAIHEK